VGAVGEIEGDGGFVADFQPFEVDDAHEIIAALPDLALVEVSWMGRHLSCFLLQERWQRERYFFLPATCLAVTAALFLAATLVFLAFFWPDFFWFAFGDLSPMVFIFL
jgi:hypothetical protein